MFYQDLNHRVLLPFSWHARQSCPIIISSLNTDGSEAACIVVADRMAGLAGSLKSLCPGALCTAKIHLPGQRPILLISVYAQPPRQQESQRALNDVFCKYPLWITGGDFNAQLSGLDTNKKTVNRLDA